MKKILLMGLFAIIGYYAYYAYQIQSSNPFKVYKFYCLALLDDDWQRAKTSVLDDQAMKAFKYSNVRKHFYAGKRRFIYYWVLAQQGDINSGKIYLRVRQTVRLDPPDENSFLGNKSVQDLHDVELKQVGDGSWRIVSFKDSSMRGY